MNIRTFNPEESITLHTIFSIIASGIFTLLALTLYLTARVVAIFLLNLNIGIWEIMATIAIVVVIFITLSAVTFRFSNKRTVEEFHGILPTFLKRPLGGFILLAGLHILPKLFFFGFAEEPVGPTIFSHKNAEGKLETVNMGDFSLGEATGAVFMGERFFQALVTVQAKDKQPIQIDANFVMTVKNILPWKAADNPFGTLLSRYEAALRAATSQFNGGDVNDVQSAIPTLVMGGIVFAAFTAIKEGDYDVGDIIRSKNNALPIYDKWSSFEDTSTGKKQKDDLSEEEINRLREKFLTRLNDEAPANIKPEGGFILDHVVAIHLENNAKAELARLGGEHVDASVEDVTQDKVIEVAAAASKAAMLDRIRQLTEAETLKRTAAVIDLSDERKIRQAEVVLAQQGKATYVIGQGRNPIAQLGGILRSNAA